MAATGTSQVAQLSVQYNYTDTGYMKSLTDGIDPGRVYWQAGSLNARGQLLAETYGPSQDSDSTISTTHSYDDASGFEKTIQSSQGAVYLQNEGYSWTSLGNLESRSAHVINSSGTSVGLSEDFSYDLLNRIRSSQVQNGSGTQAAVAYTYGIAGNMTCRSDLVAGQDCSSATYTYGGAGVGPHAVTTVAGVGTPDMDSFIKAVQGLKDRDAVRLAVRNWDGTGQVITLKLDTQYWPTYEVDRTEQGWVRKPL